MHVKIKVLLKKRVCSSVPIELNPFPQKSCWMDLREVKRPVFHVLDVIQVVVSVGGLRMANQSVGWTRDRVAAPRLQVWSQQRVRGAINTRAPRLVLVQRAEPPPARSLSICWLSVPEKKCHPRREKGTQLLPNKKSTAENVLHPPHTSSRANRLLLRAVEKSCAWLRRGFPELSYKVFQLGVRTPVTHEALDVKWEQYCSLITAATTK